MIDIPSHSSLEDRIEVARRMKEEMGFDSNVEVLVDGMDDAFNKEFAAWPIRYFVAKEGRLLHKSENSIKDDHFDQVYLQRFFGLRSITHQLRQMHEYPAITMLHSSSLGDWPPDIRSRYLAIACSSARRTCNCQIL